MNVIIQKTSYKLKNYEKYLNRKEIEKFLGENNLKSNSKISDLKSHQINKLNKLTFSPSLQIDNKILPTWQGLLENGFENNTSARKESKYVTHGLHPYKGKFYPQLVKSLFNMSEIKPGSKILDPFCGSGTTTLEGHLNGYQTFGCDLNPLAVKISQVKVEILNLGPNKFQKIISKFLDTLNDKIDVQNPIENFSENCRDEIIRWFPAKVLTKLVFILRKIDDVDNAEIRQFLLVVLSSIIRNISQQDPTDLRIRKRKILINNAPVLELYKKTLDIQIKKIIKFFTIKNSFEGTFYDPNIWLGDSRDPFSLTDKIKSKVDAIFTSPPYATALPYIDTDRLSLLTVFNYESKRRSLIEKTIIGSRDIDNSKKYEIEENIRLNQFDNISSLKAKNLIKKIYKLNKESDVGFRRQNMAALLYRYFNDMSVVFENLKNITKKHGEIFVVIGDNYTIAGNTKIIIPTTKIFKEMGTELGWSIEQIIPISVTTEGLRHIKNSIRKNYVLHFKT